jgi:hypothetical protein
MRMPATRHLPRVHGVTRMAGAASAVARISLRIFSRVIGVKSVPEFLAKDKYNYVLSYYPEIRSAT